TLSMALRTLSSIVTDVLIRIPRNIPPFGPSTSRSACTGKGAVLRVGDRVRPTLRARPQRVGLVVVLEGLPHRIPVELPLQLHGHVMEQAGRAGAVGDLDGRDGRLAGPHALQPVEVVLRAPGQVDLVGPDDGG